ncbi:MAG: glycosyltransferase family 4 protein [Bacteroidota bacterium]
MKLIYLHQYFKFPNESGGTRSYDLAVGFSKKGHLVNVVTTTTDEKYKGKKRWTRIEKEGLTVYYIYLPYDNKLSYLKRTMIFFQFLWFSSFKLLAIKADLVIATSTPLTIGVPALIKKWRQKIPFIFEARDIWPEAVIAIGAVKNRVIKYLLYKLERIIYKNAVAIVPLSVDMKRSIVNRYPKLIRKPIVVIENISEINRFQNNYDKNRSVLKEKIGFVPRFSILYAGTFGKVNGIDYVVNLAKRTIKIDPTIVFVLIGKGAQKDNIIKLSKDYGIYNKNIFFLNPVGKKDLPQFYYEVNMGSSFVIDIKELWANSANKFFDTLAAGKPILINHKGWQERTILDNNLGYVLPPQLSEKDVEDFVRYTNNSNLHKTQMQNALEKAKASYSLDIAVEKYCNIFENVK